MTKTKRKTEETPVDTSVEQLPDEPILAELAKANVTEAVIAQIKTFKELQIADIHDKEGYETVHKARMLCKKTRVLTTNTCKAGREEAIRVQKQWISVEKNITAQIEEVENDLEAKLKVIDDEKEKIKQERELKEQKLLQERAVVLLQKYGMTYDVAGSKYVLDDVSVSVIQVKTADDYVWQTIIDQIDSRWKKLEEARMEEARLREEAEAEVRRRAEEVLRREEEIKKRENELRIKEEAIKAAEAQALREEEERKRKIEEEKLEEAQRVYNEMIKSRRSSLFQLGFAQREDKLVFQTLVVYPSQLELDTEKWVGQYEMISKQVEAIKKQIEREREEREKKLVADALAKKEREEQERREKEEAERLTKEKEAQRIAAMAPDIDKMKAYCKAVSEITLPEFSSESYKFYRALIEKKRNEFLYDIFNNKPK
jgi:hypothetical protein